MTTPLLPPKKFSVYMLLKQDKLTFYPTGINAEMSTGFFRSREDAEHQRMVEVLKGTSTDMYHIYELEVPNPAYRE